jgi:hypothetical protein
MNSSMRDSDVQEEFLLNDPDENRIVNFIVNDDPLQPE